MQTLEIKCNCEFCRNRIAFEPQDEGQSAACPHCGMETKLVRPRAVARAVVAENNENVSQSTLTCCVILAALIPIAGFFAGYGVICMAVSILCGLLFLAVYSNYNFTP